MTPLPQSSLDDLLREAAAIASDRGDSVRLVLVRLSTGRAVDGDARRRLDAVLRARVGPP